MEIYNNSEAAKIYNAYKKFTGYKFQFRSGLYDTLSRISVKHMTDGLSYVHFYFKNGYSLSPAVFAKLNGLVFIYNSVEETEFAAV